MTTEKDPATQAIDDARALLDTLLASGAQQIHVHVGGTEIFIARAGAPASPMRMAAPAPAPAAVPAPAPATAPAPGVEVEVRLPHVATLVSVLPVGTAVTAGQVVASVHVLDEPEELTAPTGGTIAGVAAAAGALLDYGALVVTIREAA